MSDNTMPERITQRDARHRPVEYIRADVAQAQLDAANARIAELEAEYKLHREASLADFLKQSDEHNAEIERLKSRVAFDCRQLLAERDARIAELEAALKECADDLESEVNSRYQTGLGLVDPRQQRRYDRDMEPVSKARALLISQP